MGLDTACGIHIGRISCGARNLITDVPGVRVGHVTLRDGKDINTGVTAVLPHEGNLFRDKVMGASMVLNGFGKTIGLVQVEELGTIETPIILTNTLSVGTAATGLVRYMLEQNPDIGLTTGTVNPLVCECNDGYLNDIRGLHVKECHVAEAIAAAAEEFEEGAVGAGTGMCCSGFKGGIGSASRIISLGEQKYTVGALVLSNFGAMRDLTIAGQNIGAEIAQAMEETKDKGSIIMILATDVPLSERQLKRLCRRAGVGLARTGSFMGNGSGDIAVAFTTANRVPHYSDCAVLAAKMLHDDSIDMVFRAAAEAVEESIISSMYHAPSFIGRQGHTKPGLAEKLYYQTKE